MIFFILDDTQVETVDINKDNFPQLYKAEDKNIKKKSKNSKTDQNKHQHSLLKSKRKTEFYSLMLMRRGRG